MRAARVLRPLACGIFFLCLLLSLQTATELEGLPDLRTLRLDGAAITGKAPQTMREREQAEEQPLAFAVWGQQSGQTAANPDLGRSASPDVLTLNGSSALLFSSTAPLLPGDREGCLLDRDTAQNLFGTAEPVGSVLDYGGRKLTVRGVLNADSPLLLVQALPETEAALDRVTLQMPQGVSPDKALAEFGNRHALSGAWQPLQFWEGLAKLASLLAPLCMLGAVLFSLLRTAFSLTEYPVPFLLLLAAAGAVWFLLLWLTGFSFRFPEELVPTKWSDFDFWGRLWQQKKEELLLLLSTEKAAPELAVILPSLRGLGFGLAAAALFFPTLSRLRPKSSTGLWLWAAFFLALAFWGTISLGGGALARSRLLWLCPGVYLCTAFGARRLRDWSRTLTREMGAPRRSAHYQGRRCRALSQDYK